MVANLRFQLEETSKPAVSYNIWLYPSLRTRSQLKCHLLKVQCPLVHHKNSPLHHIARTTLGSTLPSFRQPEHWICLHSYVVYLYHQVPEFMDCLYSLCPEQGSILCRWSAEPFPHCQCLILSTLSNRAQLPLGGSCWNFFPEDCRLSSPSNQVLP